MATILCISDDIGLLETQRALLEQNGYSVLVATDRATAIEILCNHSLDAVVLDFSIIGTHGDGIMDVFMDEQPNLPITIVSGSLDCIPEPLKWYADELLQKGDDADVFLSAVERLTHISTAKKFLGQRRIKHEEQVVA